MKKRPVLALFMFALALPLLPALEIERLSPGLGVIYIPRPEAYAAQSGPSILANTLGAGLSIPLGASFAFEPGLSFYWTYHLWDPSLERGLPAELEQRTSFTLGFLLEAPFFLRLKLSDKLGIGLGLGPAFHLRAGFLAAGLEEELKSEVEQINGFFYEKGRFFLPESLIRLQYELIPNADLALTLQTLWPIFNFWNGADWFWDESIFGAQIGLRFRLR